MEPRTDDQQEINRLKGRRQSLNSCMQNCWLGVFLTLCFDSVFHFHFHETWFFIPMMFFLGILVPLLVYSYIATGMVNAKLKIYQGNDIRAEI